MILNCLAVASVVGLTQAAPKEVPFRIAEDAMVVDATVNGRKASFMFDTGFAGSIVVDDSIDLGPASGTVSLRDFVGVFQAKSVKIKTLQVGGISIPATGMVAVQQPLGDMSFGYNMHTDGIMGLEVVKGHVTEISFQKQKFIFHPKTMDVSRRVPNNKTTFLAKLLPIGGDSLEMEVAAPSGKKMILSLDTGNAFFATTHKEVLQRVGVWPEGKQPSYMKLSGVASGTIDSWDLMMPPMSIWGIPVPSSVWSIIDLPSSSAEGDGTIGFGFLKNFNITMDFERRRVWLENFTGKFGNEPVAEVGFYAGFRPSSKRVEVVRVVPSSPAAKAGVKEGDEVLSIGDQELHSTGFRKIEKMLQGDLGSKVRVALSRKGQLKRLELERAYMVNQVQP